MKIVILNGSHRKNGNCSRFSQQAKQAFEKKHSVTIFNLATMNIKHCSGCLSCEDGEKCSIKDDYSEVIEQALRASDLIVFATPTYFNMPSAAMVNLLDRTNNLCEFFAENPKKALIYLSGQTDKDAIGDACKCLQTYCEIMGMSEAAEPIIRIARMPEDTDIKLTETLKNI